MAEATRVDLEQIVQGLQKRASRGEISLEDLRDVVHRVEHVFSETVRFLENYVRMVGGKERASVESLLKRLTPLSHHVLFEKVRQTAWSLRNEKDLKDLRESVEKQGYRIINLARAGRRDEVAYLLTRIFLASGKALPDPLIRVFSPSVPDEIFRACIYAFVGVMGEKESKDSEQGGEG